MSDGRISLKTTRASGETACRWRSSNCRGAGCEGGADGVSMSWREVARRDASQLITVESNIERDEHNTHELREEGDGG